MTILQEYKRADLDLYYQPIDEVRYLPVQLPKTAQPHWTRVLLALLVEEAIADVMRPIPARKGNFRNSLLRFKREASAWLASDERSRHYLTFCETCDYLGLNCGDIRKAIAKPGFVLGTEWVLNQSRARNQRMR